MKLLIVFLASFLIACNTSKSTKEEVAASIEDSVATNYKKDSVVVEERNKALPLSKIEPAIFSFFSSLDKTQDFIYPGNGVYYIHPGQCVTSAIEKINNQPDLLGINEFLFLYRDFDFIPDSLYYNPVNFDNCNIQKEGFFAFDLKEKQTFLEEIYKINLEQINQPINEEELKKLKEIEKELYKLVIINFTNKTSDIITLQLYFALKNNHTYLAAISTSDCGA